MNLDVKADKEYIAQSRETLRSGSMDWVFEHVANKKLMIIGGEKTKLANAMIRNKGIVERFVFAIDKSDGSGYFTKLSNDF